jgi:hypothetical protein
MPEPEKDKPSEGGQSEPRRRIGTERVDKGAKGGQQKEGNSGRIGTENKKIG